jgi:hypothetical protein
MVLIAQSVRRNGRVTAFTADDLVERDGRGRDLNTDPMPRWKSRFARSSGYDPARDGRYAPPLEQELEVRS